LGSDLVPLTDNRSIATDTNYYRFKGLLAFVQAERPVETSLQNNCQLEFRSFSRFYLDQDTGGAIRGKGRVDLYFGENEYAQKAAYNLVRRGDLYFLMLKN
jgi:membrane-bound lytic murein transglycosylase A